MQILRTPPSDEGGGFCEAKDGGRERQKLYKSTYLRKINLSLSVHDTAPSSEGAFDCR